MFTKLIKLISALPLKSLHRLGWVLGWIMYLSSPTYAKRLRDNISESGLVSNKPDLKKLIKNNIIESGKALTEAPHIWFSSRDDCAKLMKKVYGWDLVEEGLKRKQGLILLTPHIGCFEIIPHYLSMQFPFTALYRPPKLKFLTPLLKFGRQRENIRLATTDVSGVRTLLKALKRGEAIGVLPDQVPGSGDGEWADFFGRPAYTMTMWSRLAERSGATVLLMATNRLSNGDGFELFFHNLPNQAEGESASRQLNRALEFLIKKNPSQFLWSYNRYKKPSIKHFKKNLPTATKHDENISDDNLND